MDPATTRKRLETLQFVRSVLFELRIIIIMKVNISPKAFIDLSTYGEFSATGTEFLNII
jgi:hypothetical protein